MSNLIGSIEVLGFSLLEANFKLYKPELAGEGGRLTVKTEFIVPESHDADNLCATIKHVISGISDDVDVFECYQEFKVEYTYIDKESFYNNSEDLRSKYCTQLVYPYIKELAENILDKSDLKDIKLPIQQKTSREKSE